MTVAWRREESVDGQVTLAALLAWLEAEDAYGQGLDVATPSEGAKPPLFARSERTLGWFKLTADTLLADGQALLR